MQQEPGSTPGQTGGGSAAHAAQAWHGYGRELLIQALKDSLAKFDPRVQIRSPVMFVVWLGALVTAASTVDPSLFGPSTASRAYNGAVTLILLLTVWFANAAEALAEGRGKAKAVALRRTRTELMARRVLPSGAFERVRNVHAPSVSGMKRTR